jgi:hypothetical protein
VAGSGADHGDRGRPGGLGYRSRHRPADRNLTDLNALEKACVRLSAYTGWDLDLSTAEGAYYGGIETLGVAGKRRQERAGPRSPGPGGAQGSAFGEARWSGCTRIDANPDEANPKKRHILR